MTDWRERECEACEGSGIGSPNGEGGHPDYPLDCPACGGSGVLRIADDALEAVGQLTLEPQE